MGDVTFLGLGLMGSALAAESARAGYQTVVWNRSAKRADTITAMGASLSTDLVDAITQSPIVVVCVSDQATANEFLHTPDARNALRGRTLIQLSSGSPRQARSGHEWCVDAGIPFLAGAIMVAPSQIGQPETVFLMSGDEAALANAKELLLTLAPRFDYLGNDAGSASALDGAILSGSLGVYLGVINGAALCEASGVSLNKYAEYLPNMASDIEDVGDSLRKIVENRLEETQAPLEVWANTTKHMIETAEDAGFSAEIPIFIRSLCDRAIDGGWGRHSMGALIKVLRREVD